MVADARPIERLPLLFFAEGKNLAAVCGDHERMLPLGGQLVVLGDRSPLVWQYFYVAFTRIDHWLDGKTHALFKDLTGAWATVVQDLGVIMKNFGDAMTTKFAYYAKRWASA